MNFYCLFEQSGTFKNVFKSYGHLAYDYDILNDYGQTDFQIDLFKEIETEYEMLTRPEQFRTQNTIFTYMHPGKDFIIAFFPCTYFSDLNENQFRMIYGQKSPKIIKTSVERVLKRIKDRAYYFELWNKFCFVCQELKIPTIIENPIGNNRRNYLKLYSAWQPSFDDNNRRKFGDERKKPTHYFAINFQLKENFQMYDEYVINLKTHSNSGAKERSEITPRYADNFYKRFIQEYVENLKKEKVMEVDNER